MSKTTTIVDELGDVFHEGEIAVQERTGERPGAKHIGAVIRDSLVPAARGFLAMQCTVALGTVDERGRPWADLWVGLPGFAMSDDGRAVHISYRVRDSSAEDPLRAMLVPRRDVGLLAIDLASRRRVRVNGIVAASNAEGLAIAVREAFPNCPKYIQRRELTPNARTRIDDPSRRGSVLDAERRSLVERIDTLFVASRHPRRGLDVSHRGGARGFVRVLDERTLRIPDYAGNGMFQTMGNFEVEPRAGIVLVDFDRDRFLSLTGVVTTSYGAEDPTHPTGGTGRYWLLGVEDWVEYSMPTSFGFRFIDSSPFNPADPGTPCQLRS
jgi:uncharacterized protein